MSTRVTLSAVVLTVLSAIQLVSPPTATADVVTLCKGYTACARAGMSDGGYSRVSGSMYWRMYSGHNCTNYAAFRMIQNGMQNVRPWEGSGNATYWGTSMSEITDSVPTVGSVAWWKAGVYPAGSAGHVAYVEQVVDANTIIISQDSWGGDFSWARVTRTRGWPSGFIHFNDLPLTNTSAPAISGDARVGSTLTATAGTWSPTADTAYQWRAGGVDVPGATAPTFTIGQAQLGKRVRVRVTASKLGYPTVSVRSPRTAPVLPGTLTNSAAPSITGEPVVDGTLTATAGSWQPTPDTLAFQWLSDGHPIPGATSEQLTTGATLVDRSVSVQVTASRSGYADVVVTSPATGPVQRATFTATADPVVSGTPRLGETLQLAAGSTSPGSSPTVQWRRGRRLIEGASGTSYVLTAGDLGRRIHARVGWDRAGYLPVRTRTVLTSRVKATPALDVRLVPRTDRLRIRTDVSVADGATLPDQLWVRSGGIRVPVPLVDGSAVTVLTGLSAGTRTVRVVVPRTRTVAASVWTSDVAISGR